MRKSYQIALINLIVLALIILPLQGLMPTSKVNLNNDSSFNERPSVKNYLYQQSRQKGASCDHCKQHSCNEKHQCNNNQCFSSAAIFIQATCEIALNLVNIKSQGFKEGLVIPPLSSLFRPPIQLVS